MTLQVEFQPQDVDVNAGSTRRVPTPGPQGEPGVSPVVSVSDIPGGHRVTITDADHPGGQSFDVMDGQDGSPGAPGQDGTSPEVTVTNITGGHRVTITDADHPGGQSFDVMDGQDGSPGAPGQDGTSPEVTVTNITGGHRVTITDADHPAGQTFDVMDGQDGSPGQDGTSPEVTVTNITGGHRVTITDADHPGGQTFDVMDGATGPTGPGVPDSGATGQLLGKKSGTNQDTKWLAPYIPYAQVDNTSTSTAFTASLPAVTEYFHGLKICLNNGVITSAAGFTINVNGLGAKPVYSNMSPATAETTLFKSDYTMEFIYDETRVAGGCWVMYRGYNSDTNTIGYQIRTNKMSLPMKSITYRYRLLFTGADGQGFVPANNSTSTNATSARTPCQDKIDPFGQIVYYGTTASVAAGSRPSASYLWEQYADITIGYSFIVSLTAWKPVYLKCAPQTDGSAIIDSSTPIVQALPSTEDGKIYIFLGVATAASTFELTLEHPVYWYNGGMIRPYTNAATPTAADVGAIPAPVSPSAGQELVYVGGAWVAADKVLIVNCTPTALNYSGVMDKYNSDLLTAYQAGKRIWFRLWVGVDSYIEAECTERWEAGLTYPSYNAFVLSDNSGTGIGTFFLYTSANSSDDNTYGATFYPALPVILAGFSDDPLTLALQPCPTTYSFGEKAEINVTVTATTQYHFSFSCPSGTPTILTINGITGMAGDTTLEAGAYYEVDVWDGIALITKIEVTAV